MERRQRDAKIKEKYGIRSLNSLIAKSEGKLADYATKKMLGENVVAATEQREQKKHGAVSLTSTPHAMKAGMFIYFIIKIRMSNPVYCYIML